MNYAWKDKKKRIWKEIRIVYQELNNYISYIVTNTLIKNSHTKKITNIATHGT